MRVVVKDRRCGASLGARYTFDAQVDYPILLDNIKLTNAVLRQYNETKSPLGYASFRGLTIRDIKSILSAVKRQEARVNVDRMGICAYYKLLV